MTETMVTPDDFVFVRMPDGSIHPVPKSEIRTPVTSTQDVQAVVEAPKIEEHFYVHLADGSVRRVTEANLPTPAGTNAPFGFWTEDSKCHHVIGIYPAEFGI